MDWKTFGEIRTMTNEKGETFFVGKDVAMALGYSNPSNALQVHVDKEDKTSYLIQVSGSNYKSKTIIINESGLYSLILSSKLEQAKTPGTRTMKKKRVRLPSWRPGLFYDF